MWFGVKPTKLDNHFFLEYTGFNKRASYNGYYLGFPNRGRRFDSGRSLQDLTFIYETSFIKTICLAITYYFSIY